MREDIVDRLRNLDAANCADSDHLHDGLIVDAADEIERLRTERDEARRMFCDLDAEIYGLFGDRDRLVVNRASYLPSDAARKRKWDCFKEPADA